jgi:hypothetical protein
MTLPQLHAHANSYPAGTYRKLFGLLGRHYAVQALDMHAHTLPIPSARAGPSWCASISTTWSAATARP